MGQTEPPAPPVQLNKLGLSVAEITSLGRQGHVTREVRGRRTTVFKLRYRFGGRQQVRYLGCDSSRAAQIEEELSELQRRTKSLRSLRALRRAARRTLRATKRRLTPLVQEAGYSFHGLAIRRPRACPVR